ncbi:MAG TPA: hypothetical protein DCW72_07035 [Elusimicrobia bacterium]|nr:MAG: hypothetical protein A2X29_02995 [Elusimicrobia bacterium GWA2_64_40]HAU89970.1 hypothetical protein [Elusimicrobiota bacterium]
MKNLLIAAMMLMPAAAGAQQNLKLGNLEINPFLSTQESYDSNIYLTKDEAKSALINRSVIGVNLVENLGSRYDLKGGYNMELLGYSRETEINNAAHHNADLGFKGNMPKGITVTVDDKWKQTTDQATSQTVERALRVENTMGFNLNAPIRGKFGFSLVAQHVYNNYLDTTYGALDREETQVGANLEYKWQPKTKFFLAYRHGILNYQTGYTNDATFDNVEVGATGQIAPKVQGTVTAGAQMRKYDDNLNDAKEDANTAQYSAQAIWKPVEKTDVTLFAKRGNVETNYGDARFYTSTLTDLSVSRMVRKFKVTLGLSYEDVRYSDKNNTLSATELKRNDENASARLLVDYNIQKWLVANFGYSYKDRSSNFDQFEYKDNVVSLGLKAMF